MEEKVRELMENKEFMDAVSNVKSKEELKSLLSEKGIEAEDVNLEAAMKYINGEEEVELDEADLNNASGGIAIALAAVGGCAALYTAAFGTALAFSKWYKKR